MADKIQIDTGIVSTTAATVQNLNTEIDAEFEKVIEEVGRLQQHWAGSAADHMNDEFYEMKKRYYDDPQSSRRVAMHNYAVFLNEIVSPGYEATEMANTSLADLFK